RPETFQVFTVEQAQATTASGGWVAPQIGNASNVFGTHVNVAPDGSSYATGTYYGSLDFDPGPGVANRISMSDGGNYLVKYDSNGNFVWVATVGAEDDYPGGTAIAPGGEVYLVGTFSPPQDFDPGPGTEFRTQGNAYCLKLSAAGAFQWVQTWDAPLQIYNSRVVVDAGGNPRISGIFRGTVDFDPGAGTANHTSGTDAYDPFLVALGAAGQYQWSRNWGGGTGSQQLLPWGLDISPVGQYAVANVLTGTGDFDPGPGVANLTAVGQGDAYVLKLDSAGNYLWARSWGGPFSDGANGVEFDAAGNVRVAGEFHDTVDFDPGAGVVNRTAVGSTDGFALALDAAGTFQWVGTFGGL
ncbi:MAG TPA: hypothetical protein VEI97_01670, partial [bacterium]|nr:hypothetical protein [bacterium]